ncbi:LA_2272 family surface repeat-containing protein [Myxococcus xanthus]|uniref:LA_2272 family surface repeat-containing protein n=1 Tax=Myxococcus TaxID=32 RepID=UPI00112784BD|nr:hypothetical protein BHS07_02200 [Myxococcus xanthus]QDE94782.1 hypothetical protein BHS05_02230 [Myxococcus xanthus]
MLAAALKWTGDSSARCRCSLARAGWRRLPMIPHGPGARAMRAGPHSKQSRKVQAMNRKVSVCAGMMAAVVAFSASAEETAGGQSSSAASSASGAASVDWPGVARELSAPPLVAAAEQPVSHTSAAGAPAGSASASGAVNPVAPSNGASSTPVVPATTDAVGDASRLAAKPVASTVDAVVGGEVSASAPEEGSAEAKAETDANEVHIPFSLTLVPGLSTSGFHTGNVVNNVSIGLVATHAKRVDGLAMSLAGNWVGEGGLSGAQLAVGANVARGPVTGAQFSVGANVAGADLLGLQSTVGVNVVRGNAEGAQLAVGGNIASGEVNGTQMAVAVNVAGKSLLGAQLGVGANVSGGPVRGFQAAVGANIATGRVHGLQASAGLNVAGQMTGLQMSSGVSYVRNLSGAQLSIINVGGEVDGAQVGIVNIASNVTGAQVGLLNVARELDGEAVGLLSFVGGGQAHVQAWASDVALTNVGVKLGGRHIYSLFTVGYSPSIDEDRRRYVIGAGLGGHIPAGRFFFDVDVVSSTLHTKRLFDDTNHVLGQLRLTAGWQVARHFAVFGGVSANTLVTWDDSDPWKELGIGPQWRHVADDGRTTVRMWPGLLAGVQI